MKQKLRGLIDRFRAQATPEQMAWIIRILACTSAACLWKAAHTTWPSLWMALVGMAVLVVTLVCFYKVIRITPSLHKMMPYGAIPIFIGAFLNLIVIIANNGYMPCPLETGMNGIYIPMEGARVAHLGDWVWGFISPGDVLMAIGMVGVVRQLRGKAEPAPLAQEQA